MWQRLFVYRNMINDVVLDSVAYISKSSDPNPEYWSEELLKIMEKAEDDGQLQVIEKTDIINLIEKAYEQLNLKLSVTMKSPENSGENDYTRLDKHLVYETQSVEPTPVPETKIPVMTKEGKPQGPLANFSPPQPPAPAQIGPVLGDLTKMPLTIGRSTNMVNGVPIQDYLIAKEKSKFKSMQV